MNTHRFAFSILALASATALIAAEPAAPIQSQDLAGQIATTARNLLAKNRGAICRVEAEDEHGPLSGTGFFMDADGTLFTSYGVVANAENIIVDVGNEKYPATRSLADERSGIAILKITAPRPMPFIPAGKSTELEIGSPLLSIGYPLTLPLSSNLGMVAGFDIGLHGRYFATRLIRINTPVRRGQGGSPILNFKGEAIGILISGVDGNNGIFALPIEAANKVLNDFRATGRISQGWLGVDIRTTGAEEHGSSARIRKVQKESPGFTGGLRPGDVLLKVGDWKITSPEDVLNASFYLTAGDPLKARISRGGKIIELTLVPAPPPNRSSPTVERQPLPLIGSTELGP
jgi:serine protease Do